MDGLDEIGIARERLQRSRLIGLEELGDVVLLYLVQAAEKQLWSCTSSFAQDGGCAMRRMGERYGAVSARIRQGQQGQEVALCPVLPLCSCHGRQCTHAHQVVYG